MGLMVVWSVLSVCGAVGGVAVGMVARCRARRGRSPSGLDAEAEANQWIVRLAGGLVPPDVRAWEGADESAARALTSAVECHRTARARLAAARSAGEYEEVTQVAREGIRHLYAARTALGLDSDQTAPASPRGALVPVVGGFCSATPH
ncbi:hypothetical protein ABZ137_34515 [Streptomyces bobili]|uniref:hypothetical protein n=1 Tax=Streptomyces bobili TaxID=67280 RepID=UPI0033B2E19E